jgi:hypothetical protein
MDAPGSSLKRAVEIWQKWLDAHDKSDLPCLGEGDCSRCESIAFATCELQMSRDEQISDDDVPF